MRMLIASLALLSLTQLGGCSGEEPGANTDAGAGQQTAPVEPQVSQAETMEEIWASDLDTTEKARRVKELLARGD